MQPTLTGTDKDGFEFAMYPMEDRFAPTDYYKADIRVLNCSDNKTVKEMFGRIMVNTQMQVKREKIDGVNTVTVSVSNFIASMQPAHVSVMQATMIRECIGRFMNAFTYVMIVDR